MTSSRSDPQQSSDSNRTESSHTPNDPDGPLSPEAMLQLVHDQQRHVRRTHLSPIPWMMATWGVAWTVGFLLMWSVPPGGNPWFRVPSEMASTSFAVLLIMAMAISAFLGFRIGRGVKGPSTFAGAVYGISWFLCGGAFAALGVALVRNGMSSELASLFFPSAFALMAGALYLAGAALWRSVSQLVLGILLLLVGAVSPFFGAPANNLVLAVLGGGGFLVMAVVFSARQRRAG